MNESEYRIEYQKWFASQPKETQDKLKKQGLDKPLNNSVSHKTGGGGIEGMQLSKGSQVSEASPYTLALIAEDYYELTHVLQQSPLEEIIEEERIADANSAELRQEEIARVQQDGISAFLAYLFRPVNGSLPSPIQVAQKIYILAYTIRPELIEGWSLERIAKCFDSTRQVFSKRLIKMDAELNLHARNHKSTEAVSLFREGTKKWWDEKHAAEADAKRKEYLEKWRAANAVEIAEYQKQYREKNKARLNTAKRNKRKEKK